MRRKELTDAQIAEAAELHASGIALNKLCRKYNVSDVTLGKTLKRHGFPVRTRSTYTKNLTDAQITEAAELHASGMSLNKLCGKYNVRAGSLGKVLRQHDFSVRSTSDARRVGKKLTDAQVSEAAELHASGIPLTKLCGRYNVWAETLGKALKRHGFPVTPPRDSHIEKLTWVKISEAAELHASGIPLTRICGRYNITDQTLSLVLKRYGFIVTTSRDTRRAQTKLTNAQIAEAAELHASGIPLTKLCGKYNVAAETLRRGLKRCGFLMPRTSATSVVQSKLSKLTGAQIAEAAELHASGIPRTRKYSCDVQFFSSFCDEARCYWAGFITADGCIMVSTPNSKRLKIAIASDDRGHLEKFKSCLRAENPIRYEKKSGKIGVHEIRSNGIVSIVISSKQLCDDLSNNGIGPRKTSHERIPEAIPKDCMHHFIRGYLDGDGWLQLGHLPGWEAVGFCGGYDILNQIRQWIRENIPETGNPGIIKVPGMYRIQYQGGRQTRAIIGCLYKDCTIALDRKVAVAVAILQRHSKGHNRKRLRLAIGGEVRTLEEWAKLTGVRYTTAYSRLRRGISPELAIRPTEGHLVRRRGQKKFV